MKSSVGAVRFKLIVLVATLSHLSLHIINHLPLIFYPAHLFSLCISLESTIIKNTICATLSICLRTYMGKIRSLQVMLDSFCYMYIPSVFLTLLRTYEIYAPLYTVEPCHYWREWLLVLRNKFCSFFQSANNLLIPFQFESNGMRYTSGVFVSLKIVVIHCEVFCWFEAPLLSSWKLQTLSHSSAIPISRERTAEGSVRATVVMETPKWQTNWGVSVHVYNMERYKLETQLCNVHPYLGKMAKICTYFNVWKAENSQFFVYFT